MLLLALAAGVLAAVNPCGFALLPAYLSLLVLGEQANRRTAVLRALLLTAGMTAGFMAVFGLFGVVLASVADVIQARLSWFTVVFGVLLAGLGGWLLAGRSLPALPWKPSRAPTLTRSLPSMMLFGAAYALASLGCTIGPFLAIVVSSMRLDYLEGVGLFLAYAMGMGLVVGAAALAVALVRTSVLARIRRAGPVLFRAAGALLLLTGAYVAYYGWYEIRLAAGGSGVLGDPVVRAAGVVQHLLARTLDAVGVPVVCVVFAVLLVAGLLVRREIAGRFRWSERRRRVDQPS
jgi:cytochrome c-type biogenesis protein